MKSIAGDSFSGSGNQTVKCRMVRNELAITNDGTANLTFTLGSDTYTLRSGFTFDEKVNPFDIFTINATDVYFGYCRRAPEETR